jgi:hypothetical protein
MTCYEGAQEIVPLCFFSGQKKFCREDKGLGGYFHDE